MKTMIELMADAFTQLKGSGSYFLLYLLALGFGLMAAWERCGGKKTEDSRNPLWPFFFGLFGLGLIVANPAALWLINRISPLEGHYHQLGWLLMAPFLIAYAASCGMGLLRERRRRNVLAVGFILLIGLAGSSYGLLSARQGEGIYHQEREAMRVVEGISADGSESLLAPDRLLEYARMHYPQITLLYGKDLYTQGLDLGIMDAYEEGLLGLYELMQSPGGNLDLLGERAASYGCGILALEWFEEAPEVLGEYILAEETGGYLIYAKEG